MLMTRGNPRMTSLSDDSESPRRLRYIREANAPNFKGIAPEGGCFEPSHVRHFEMTLVVRVGLIG
jgi:hypothetical protein